MSKRQEAILNYLIGLAMKETKGSYSPQLIKKMLIEMLDE